MPLGDWTTTFETLPPDSETAGLGDDRIRTGRIETRTRGAVEMDWGDATFGATYGDTGRLLPGAGRMYRATGALPTKLQLRDGTDQTGTLGTQDTGRLCLDQRGWTSVVQMWDGALSTPAWVGIGQRPNLLANGSMCVDQRSAGAAKNIAAGARAVATSYTLDRWAVISTGATAVVQQVTAGLPTNAISKYGLKVTGAVTITQLDISQRIEARDAALWAGGGGYVTISVGYKYDDGAAGTVTPTLRIDTPGGADDWTVATNRASQALTASADTYASYTVDLTTLTNYANGLDIILRIGAGKLDAATKSITITDFIIEPGQAKSQKFTHAPFAEELARCRRYYQKTFAYATAPVTNAGTTTGPLFLHSTVAGNGSAVNWMHDVEMRAAPTITGYSPGLATNDWYDFSHPGASVTPTTNATTRNSTIYAPAATANHCLCLHATANAEL